MRTMTRYVLIDLLSVFLFALTGLTVMMLLVGVVREAIAQGLPPAEVFRLIPFILPDALRFSTPVTLLLSVTLVYSRMSGYNEVVALKALGISPMVFFWPAIVISFLLSLVTVWLNDMAVSWGRSGAERVIIEAVEEIAYGMLRTDHRYSSRQFSINVKAIEGRRLIRPAVSILARGSTPAIFITADHAELYADHRENLLKIMLFKGTMDVEGRATARFPDRYELEIPLTDASRADETSNSPSCMPLWRIPAEIVKQREELEHRQEEHAARAAWQMLTGDFATLTGGEWPGLAWQVGEMKNRLHRLRLEPYRRWSAGFACFCFVWVGAPMGVWLRKREALTTFFLCFLPILAVYYPLLIYGINGAKGGTIHPICVWAGNGLLFLWGIWALRKVLRY